jgi:hypothetical protein
VSQLACVAQSIRGLAGLGDGPMNPSPRVMNRIYIYIYIVKYVVKEINLLFFKCV